MHWWRSHVVRAIKLLVLTPALVETVCKSHASVTSPHQNWCWPQHPAGRFVALVNTESYGSSWLCVRVPLSFLAAGAGQRLSERQQHECGSNFAGSMAHLIRQPETLGTSSQQRSWEQFATLTMHFQVASGAHNCYRS